MTRHACAWLVVLERLEQRRRERREMERARAAKRAAQSHRILETEDSKYRAAMALCT